jgi:hypothetical protein
MTQDNFIFNYTKKGNPKLKKLQNDITNNNLDKIIVKNLTNHIFPNHIEGFLSLGPKFNINNGSKKREIFELITDVEYIINGNTNSKQILRQRICNLTHNHIVRNDKNMDLLDRKITKIMEDTTKYIKNINNSANNMEHIYVLNSDKGNVTTIMYKKDYEKEMLEMLNDRENFRVSRKNITNELQTELLKILNKLVHRNFITKEEMENLHNNYPVSPKIYGLPKIHKIQNQPLNNYKVPLRIITCFINSPLEKLSKYLSEILSKIQFNESFNIQNSYQCVTLIQNIQLPQNYILISLDVIKLFPSIPLRLIIKSINKRWQQIKEHTKISQTMFEDLITLCYQNSYCEFRGIYYRQIKGLPMGSSLPPIVSDYVMTDLILFALSSLQFEIPIIFKYVDDLLLGIPSDQSETVLKIFNSYNKNIKFTLETEVNGKIPFLDILITRSDKQTLQTQYYSKPTASQRIISYTSNHHITQKTNTALGLINRIFLLDNVNTDIKKCELIHQILRKNGYPKIVINSLIKRFKSQQITNNTEESENNNNKYRCIPYIKGLSEKIAKFLKHEDENLKIAFKNKKQSGIFTNTKDKTENLQMTNTIYSVPCITENCGKYYFGMTRTSLKKRMQGHQADLNAVTKHNVMRTALCQHTAENKHTFDLLSAKPIHQNNNYTKLAFLEMLYINDNTNICVNKKSDFQDLNKDYKTILHLINKRKKYIEPSRTQPG